MAARKRTGLLIIIFCKTRSNEIDCPLRSLQEIPREAEVFLGDFKADRAPAGNGMMLESTSHCASHRVSTHKSVQLSHSLMTAPFSNNSLALLLSPASQTLRNRTTASDCRHLGARHIVHEILKRRSFLAHHGVAGIKQEKIKS